MWFLRRNGNSVPSACHSCWESGLARCDGPYERSLLYWMAARSRWFASESAQNVEDQNDGTTLPFTV